MFLPVELITRILSFLPFKDIVICARLSRHFYRLVETSTILQYIIELGLCGLVDSGRGGFNPAERLLRLREREDAWLTLSWHSSNIPVGKKYNFWELCGGVFAGSYRSQISYTFRTFDTIDFFELDSRTEAGPAKTIALGGRFCCFSMDPGQDLLILVNEPPLTLNIWVVHIRTLSDFSAHPRAIHDIIKVPVAHETWHNAARTNDFGFVETQILGNLVLFCQRRGPGFSGSLSVFEWTTGTMTFMIYPPLGDWCGALISEERLLLSQRPSFRKQPCLELYDIRPRSKWDAPRITYLLPFGGDDTWRTSECYGPASCSYTGGASLGPLRPFVPTSHPLLLAFRFIRPSAAADQISTLDMFLIPSKLQRYGRMNDVVQWEEWGPRSTRWFNAILPRHWRRNIQGYRVVLGGTVLDFNPNFPTENEDDVVYEPSHIPSEVTGGNAIVSSLPYRAFEPHEPFENANVLLDDQIVCVETDPHELGMVKSLRMLSF